MREIKFRGLRTDGKGWVYGWYSPVIVPILGILGHCINEGGYKAIDVHPESVGQFTGLQDNNGIDIYEGDIINWFCNNGETEIEQVKHSLDWDRVLSPSNAPFMSAWGSTCGKYFKTFMNIYDPTRYASIIGNIQEHKHLLK